MLNVMKSVRKISLVPDDKMSPAEKRRRIDELYENVIHTTKKTLEILKRQTKAMKAALDENK